MLPSDYNPYVPPQAPSGNPQPPYRTHAQPPPARYAYASGHLLVLHRLARLPDACMKCGTSDWTALQVYDKAAMADAAHYGHGYVAP